uniref:NADH-ubiquinone oxidoreductase chain 2 n=1 Tax=Priasilpha obscura TaxID=295936 RepID=B6D8X0_9CUCU|nr:NADH dehydrogenase subunit 2 [Priasilpha obscura]ACF35108.1 NADH dehydrogenase subunit 2 [Priasilpha obscura]
MLNFYKILFINSMILGTMMTISSYSWLSMWMGLEINLLSLIPLMSNPKSIYPSESALKYFITQTMASTILLFSIILLMNKTEFIPMNSNNSLLMIMNSAILTKMGAAPFHFWFPEVMEGLNWMNCLIILTWQKIAPMIIFMYNIKMTIFLSSIIIISSIISGIMGINQISLRKILTYSSINHIGWMLASMMMFQSIWIIYFLIYSFISMNIIFIFNKLKIFYLNQLFNKMNNKKLIKFFFMMNFLSLGGLPPFLGFLPKWLTINNLVINNFYMISLVLIILTLMTLFFYLRITFSTMILYSSENTLNQIKINKFMIYFFNSINLFGLLTCTLMFNFS